MGKEDIFYVLVGFVVTVLILIWFKGEKEIDRIQKQYTRTLMEMDKNSKDKGYMHSSVGVRSRRIEASSLRQEQNYYWNMNLLEKRINFIQKIQKANKKKMGSATSTGGINDVKFANEWERLYFMGKVAFYNGDLRTARYYFEKLAKGPENWRQKAERELKFIKNWPKWKGKFTVEEIYGVKKIGKESK